MATTFVLKPHKSLEVLPTECQIVDCIYPIDKTVNHLLCASHVMELDNYLWQRKCDGCGRVNDCACGDC